MADVSMAPGPTTGADKPENESMSTEKSCREKYWGELTDGEKIERLRSYVRALPDLMERQSREIAQLRAQFVEHAHVGDKVVSQIKQYGNQEQIGFFGRMRSESGTECYI